MNPSEPIDRFKFNALMTLGFLWVAVSGTCTIWLMFERYAKEPPMNQFTIQGLPMELIAGWGTVLLLPGLALWWLGKRVANYDPMRDLKHVVWRAPQAIGIAGAIWLWVLGARDIAWAIGDLRDGACFSYDPYCSHVFRYAGEEILSKSAPGWLLYWVSTRP